MVRAARKSDREVVGRLWSALLSSQGAIDDRYAASEDADERFENDFPQWLQSESRKLYVAEDDGTVCGFVSAERWGPPPIHRECPGIYVQELFVDEGFRRRGHGRDLVDAVRSWGDRVGAHELRAGVVAANDGACAFWKSVGGGEISRTFAVKLEASETKEEPGRRRIGFNV